MKTVPLTRGYIATVDDEDYARVSKFKWVAQPSYRTVYAMRTIWRDDGTSTTIRLHRFILNLANSNIKVDHRNHNGLDNTRLNLRIATPADNSHNQHKRMDASSQFKGVTFEKRKRLWRARIHLNGKRVGLGRFRRAEDAARTYDSAAVKHYGEFACINFPRRSEGTHASHD